MRNDMYQVQSWREFIQVINSDPKLKRDAVIVVKAAVVIVVGALLFIFVECMMAYTADNDEFEAAAACAGFSVSQRNEGPDRIHSEARFGLCRITYDVFDDELKASEEYYKVLGFNISKVKVNTQNTRSSSMDGMYVKKGTVVLAADYHRVEKCEKMTHSLVTLSGLDDIIDDNPILSALERRNLKKELCPAKAR